MNYKVDETTQKIIDACGTKIETMAGAYFIRFIVPLLFFIPLFIFGLTTLNLVVTLAVYFFIHRSIENSCHAEFAAIYSARHFNLATKKKAKNGGA